MDSPFNLTDDAAYQRWRDQKLAGYPSTAEELIVEVENPEQLSSHEYEHLLGLCKKTNMAIYSSRWELQDKKDMLNIARQFGLNRLDKHLCADDIGVSALRDDPVAQRHEYIPYTNRAINWHTDGYYNTPGHQIRAMMLHCASAAESGGSNQVFDHELLYIHLREQNPAFIKALMQPEVMTIPANVQGGKEIRPALTGPVFSIIEESGDLHLRYTARTRSIEWQQDALTLEAVAALENILDSRDITKFEVALKPGQGIVSNNVLHTRTAFQDASDGNHRLVYRIRSYDRINATQLNQAA